MAEIKELNAGHIHQANYNSFGGTRGDSSCKRATEQRETAFVRAAEVKRKLWQGLREEEIGHIMHL